VPGITRDRVRRSLVRFRQLIVSSRSPAELKAAVNREFAFYKSVGKDNQGTVLFTGYFEPIYAASRTPTPEYRYPLYRLPADFDRWKTPHPTRAVLEGEDGLGTKSPLRGRELVWLRDRLEAFLVQVQGSARFQLPDGKLMSVGFAGKTNYPYVSLGRELIKDGKLPQEGLTLPVLIDYFRTNPAQLSQYIPRNQSFVFFKETYGAPATGSIGVPVTAERSIATDKSLMPPGALALINAPIPYPNAAGQLESRMVSRYVLDQDTGSAIKGAGRVDIFMGTGPRASDRAGLINGSGELYYLLLKK
jgi:membrane-bound lytic murein transglycosylase A